MVVLDRATGETFTEDIGDDNPVAVYIPGVHAHGFEALTDILFCYHVTVEYDPADPDEHTIRLERSARRTPMELEHADPVRAGRRRRVLITGAGGQLGHALRQAFAADDVLALSHADWDVAQPPATTLRQGDFDLVLHTAAWTDVDGAEADPQSAAAVNIAGTAHAASLQHPARHVLDRLRLRRTQALAVRRVGRTEPDVRLRPDEAPRRGGGRAGRRG